MSDCAGQRCSSLSGWNHSTVRLYFRRDMAAVGRTSVRSNIPEVNSMHRHIPVLMHSVQPMVPCYAAQRSHGSDYSGHKQLLLFMSRCDDDSHFSATYFFLHLTVTNSPIVQAFVFLTRRRLCAPASFKLASQSSINSLCRHGAQSAAGRWAIDLTSTWGLELHVHGGGGRWRRFRGLPCPSPH